MELYMKCLIAIFLIKTTVSEYCIQGEDEGCRFECHCANDNECREGTCPGGCHTSALGYNWRGPACQIGNVGLHKRANMTVVAPNYKNLYPSAAALDGQIAQGINNHCAHPINNHNKPAEWWGDLGDIYRIYNITIYGRLDCCEKRLQQFDLTIYNTSNNEKLCRYRSDIIYSKATITCNAPVIGRYVHFKRIGGDQIYLSGLCEVVIIGHKVYDCSKCPTGVTCNDVTGCQSCRGSYQPECKPECRNGSYGINCRDRCGNCKANYPCHKVSGQCLEGCQLWWTDEKCFTYIDKPVHKNETIQVLSTTSDSVEVTWEKLTSISANLSQFYGYVFVYKDINTTNYTEFVSRGHNTSSDVFVVEVSNLNFNTKYDIQVWPYREMYGEREFGSLYDTLHVKTKCTAPEKPSILNVTLITDNDHLLNITVYIQSVAEISANCHEITNISINYKMKEEEPYSQITMSSSDNVYTIIPDKEGQYEIWITVTNNEGYSSDSDKYIINAKRSTESPKYTAIYVGVPVVIIVAVIIVVVIVVLWKRRKLPAARQQYINKAFTSDQLEPKSRKNKEHKTASKAKPTQAGSSQSKSRQLHSEKQESAKEDSTTEESIVEESIDDIEQQVSQLAVQCLDDVSVTIGDGQGEEETRFEPEECIYANSALSIVNFEGYVAKRMAEMKTLVTEYEGLPEPDLYRCLTAVTDSNKDKNRYRKIYPYDDTRVSLETNDQNKDDYINATYITGYNKTKEYIATQGPKANTLTDFWSMVWQEKSNRIVMVANVVEMGKKKVEPYWCECVGETRLLGDFTIKTESLETSADYDIRIMTVKKGNQQRKVHHFHFKTWEDKSKPRFGAHTLLAFMYRVHSVDKRSEGPLIVHCSAGVGRTGSFIALDILQQMAIKDNSVDIYNCVEKLRRERMLMVQTKEQYVFLHEAMVEFLKYMSTSQDCSSFTQLFASVCDQQPDPEIMAGLEKEFKYLLEMKKAKNSQSKSGLSDMNKNKNRNLKMVPDDSERLFISTRNGNYINVVSVDSYAKHDSIIVTQMPLPHTVGDFWKLVMEQNCQAIVMLNDLDSNDPTCIPYWPEEIRSKKTYEQMEVELLATDVDKTTDFIVRRDLRVKEIKQKTFAPPEVMTIRQFQLKSWPNDETLPPQRAHLFDLMNQIQNWQRHKKISPDKWKILVHCIDGGSRSGMFCGASFMLEKIKKEQEVNVYLAARSVSRRRPQFFTSIVEYQFLYQMAEERLTETNQYVNFS